MSRLFIVVYILAMSLCVFLRIESWPFSDWRVFAQALSLEELRVYSLYWENPASGEKARIKVHSDDLNLKLAAPIRFQNEAFVKFYLKQVAFTELKSSMRCAECLLVLYQESVIKKEQTPSLGQDRFLFGDYYLSTAPLRSFRLVDL